nr:LytTR family DNA-binding domain-containing protein [Caulobacter sp. 17J65-9]
MVALRHAVWAVAGRSFQFDFAGEWLYEYRKDLLGYALLALVFWLGRRRARRAERPDAAPDEAAAPAFVTLQDGVRPVRFAAGEVLAAEASGNYVELVLAGGRRPLVRTTLARALEALAAHGFVRTHRSWIVCAGRVVEVDPTGTGDWLLRLDGGVEAPLSRRFPEALRRIREQQAAA